MSSSKGSAKPERLHGIVENFLPRKGYGFIKGDDGASVFVHFSAIRDKAFRTLVRGEEVEFSVVQGDKGLQARDVVRLNPPPADEGPPLKPDGRTW